MREPGSDAANRIPLPPEFLRQMAELLGEEFPAFLASYAEPAVSGLRVNTLKLSPAAFRKLSPFPLSPVPWCAAGFILSPEHEAGKHPFHAAGLYYLQDPSAMVAAELLAARPGERVLDLCAAPGGKATHLAAQLQGEGLLVANEVIPARARVLNENLERWGATNAIITVETPERLAARWPGYFDRVLVDAPCSGEGMFRKSDTARQEWQPEQVAGCALRQSRILDTAAALVRPGGMLAYATCTFALEENEGVIVDFLARHPEFAPVHIPLQLGFRQGILDAVGIRLWPHLVPGEGHYIALLRRQGDAPPAPAPARRQQVAREAVRAFAAFCAENLRRALSVQLYAVGAALYHLPPEAPDLSGLRYMRPGWELGTLHRDRFEPAHALALGLTAADAQRTLDLAPADERVRRYLQGEVLDAPGEAGWLLVTVAGYPLGWGKRVGRQIKNHYPRALRWPMT